jgi:hypothetical protein
MRQAARDRTGTIGGGKRTTRRSGTARDGYRAATMPGTPLAGFLARFVADAHAADQDGPRPTPTDTGRRRFLAGASAAVRAQQFCQQVEPVFNGTLANWNGLAAHDTWHDQPLQRCSYAYWRVGQCQLFAGVEGEREGNAWFCGEHTSLDAHGYLEGAVETGERAASQVATAIG